ARPCAPGYNSRPLDSWSRLLSPCSPADLRSVLLVAQPHPGRHRMPPLARAGASGEASSGNGGRMIRAWALAAALVLCAATPGAAQQAEQDRLGGRFGSFETASPPREAAHQAELMSHALAQLQPQQPGKTDVYLIVASLWGQPVFESEATQAAQLLEQHL